ncbi:Predicted secreted protein [Roseateles sp. YR242]|uniref:SIMPL domain-containing protein n=1 Tax=Roseateles sp. YR242 TaxID=1855305 RepID=UPI0008D1A694|nr:SIMPL domain-containing protein [Roseateles sp. YR242]SEK31334.1 Predicted secreted protein [Roseateles sp. YR242]
MTRKQHWLNHWMVAGSMGTLLAVSATTLVQAQTVGPRTDVLNLQASASTEVARDLLTLTFSTTREGKEPSAVQGELKQALDAALAEARKVAKPGQVDVQAGAFSVYPRYGEARVNNRSNATQITGWIGSVELVVRGRDMDAISQLTSRIRTLNIAGVNYGLSREAREKAEESVVADAIANYKTKAGLYAKQFGYRGFQIGEVSVNTDGGAPMMAERMYKPMATAAADMALPVESGKATVTVSVNGNVVMTR